MAFFLLSGPDPGSGPGICVPQAAAAREEQARLERVCGISRVPRALAMVVQVSKLRERAAGAWRSFRRRRPTRVPGEAAQQRCARFTSVRAGRDPALPRRPAARHARGIAGSARRPAGL
jgi:hypothetical protein